MQFGPLVSLEKDLWSGKARAHLHLSRAKAGDGPDQELFTTKVISSSSPVWDEILHLDRFYYDDAGSSVAFDDVT